MNSNSKNFDSFYVHRRRRCKDFFVYIRKQRLVKKIWFTCEKKKSLVKFVRCTREELLKDTFTFLAFIDAG